MDEVWHRKSWRWFTARVFALLSDDNPFSRRMNPQSAKEEQQTEQTEE